MKIFLFALILVTFCGCASPESLYEATAYTPAGEYIGLSEALLKEKFIDSIATYRIGGNVGNGDPVITTKNWEQNPIGSVNYIAMIKIWEPNKDYLEIGLGGIQNRGTTQKLYWNNVDIHSIRVVNPNLSKNFQCQFKYNDKLISFVCRSEFFADQLAEVVYSFAMGDFGGTISDSSSESPVDRLREAKNLYDSGLISEEEFSAKKEEILSDM